jgi:hypothetical protein
LKLFFLLLLLLLDDDNDKNQIQQEPQLLIYLSHSLIEFKYVYPSAPKSFYRLIPIPLQLRHQGDP